MAAKAIDLYHALWSPPSRFVRMLGRAVGAEFNLIECDPLKRQHMTPEFLQMNPMHTVPTINDNGFVLWESRAIGHYLVNKFAPHSPLVPQETRARALYDQRLFFDYNLLKVYSLPMRRLFGGATRFDAKDLRRCREQMKLLDLFLAQHAYLAGERITMVDYSAAATLVTSTTIANTVEYKNVDRWLSRMRQEIDGFEEINQPGVQLLADFMEAVLDSDEPSAKL